MNKEVSFPIAKLLKEKGFDKKTQLIYNTESELSNIRFSVLYSAPTIAEVVMWLYEKHGIWVYPFRHNFNNEFYWHIDTPHEDEFTSDMNFNSPTEAYEAGIKYSLEYLVV